MAPGVNTNQPRLFKGFQVAMDDPPRVDSDASGDLIKKRGLSPFTNKTGEKIKGATLSPGKNGH
jgi:hypothetical protein